MVWCVRVKICMFLKPDAEPDLWWVLAVELLVRWADNVKTVDT